MNSQKKHVRMQLLELMPDPAGAGNFVMWRCYPSGLSPMRSPDGKGWYVPVITEIDITMKLSPASNIPAVIATPGQYTQKVMLLNNDDEGDMLNDGENWKNKASSLWCMEDLVCWPDMDPATPVVPGTPKRAFFADQVEIPVTNPVYCAVKIEQDSDDLGGFLYPIGHIDWILEYKWVYYSQMKFQAELSALGTKKNLVYADDKPFIPP